MSQQKEQWGEILHVRPRKSLLTEVTAFRAVCSQDPMVWKGCSEQYWTACLSLLPVCTVRILFPSKFPSGYKIHNLLTCHAELLLNSCSVSERIKEFLGRPLGRINFSVWWDWEGTVVIRSHLYLPPWSRMLSRNLSRDLEK